MTEADPVSETSFSNYLEFQTMVRVHKPQWFWVLYIVRTLYILDVFRFVIEMTQELEEKIKDNAYPVVPGQF
jgi:hypothetical protein